MKKIKLSKNKYALVDDEDYELLSKFTWHENNGYARTVIYMHHFILPNQENKLIDHKNLNRFDNRRENLRYVNRSQSQSNRTLQSNNTSGYRGVDWSKKMDKWRAQIRVNYVKIYLGYFNTKKEAAKAYNEAATKYFGEYARLNIIE